MRGRVFLSCGAAGCVALTGCGLLSGLDGLNVDASTPSDASGDGDAPSTIDAATMDAADAADARDAGDASDAAATPGVIHCGANTCTGGMACCITVANQIPTYACVKDCSGGTTLALRCDDEADCNGSQICCLSNGVAQCTLNTSCANQLCATPQECVGNTAQCALYDAGSGVKLSHCQ